MSILKTQDPEVYASIQREVVRQKESVELIPSENIVSQAVLEAQGSILTNKYAEGYPGRRYYGGCQFVDEVETLAIERAKKLFGAEYANVQPHSGTGANMGVFFSFLEAGDRIMGMKLTDGGHLTHGAGVNFSGFLYDVVDYGVTQSEQLIDYDEVRDVAKKTKPKMIIAGASAYPRVIDFKAFGEIAKEVGAYLLCDIAHIAGLVAAGVHPSPVGHADFVTTTTHKTLRGPRGGMILAKEEYGKRLNFRICPGIQGGPLMHVIAAKAVAFKEAMTEGFVQYQKNIVLNAQALGRALQERGFNLVSGGTDNHLVLIDLRNKGLTGKDAEKRLDEVGITCNKNTVPFETEKPLITSGIRLGTPVLTTRGMGPSQMEWLAGMITQTLETTDERQIEKIRQEVGAMCREFPIYKNL